MDECRGHEVLYSQISTWETRSIKHAGVLYCAPRIGMTIPRHFSPNCTVFQYFYNKLPDIRLLKFDPDRQR